MGNSDEEDDPVPKGRLVEDDFDPEALFGHRGRGGRSPRIVVFQDKWQRTYHAELTNTLRGETDKPRKAIQHSAGEYILRERRYAFRADEILAKGGDPDHVDAYIRRVSEQARNWNSAIALHIVIELPNELPLDGKIAIAQFEANRLAESGRPALWAIHPAARRRKKPKAALDQDHLHLIGPARPVTLLYGVLVVCRGKYLPDRAAIRVWREGLATEVNLRMAEHALCDSIAPRWSAGTLREMGVDRPTKMRLSARAALRDEPDLSHPADQLPLAWNDAIDRGVNPLEDSVVSEELERRRRHRIQDKFLREIAELKSSKRRPSSPSQNIAAASPRTSAPAPSPAQPGPLPPSEMIDAALAHWRFNYPLPADWALTGEGRAAAKAIRNLYFQRFDELFFRAGFPAPPAHDPNTTKIYLSVPDERRTEALRLGANFDSKHGAFIWSSAPQSVVGRLRTLFPKTDTPAPSSTATQAATPPTAAREPDRRVPAAKWADILNQLSSFRQPAPTPPKPQSPPTTPIKPQTTGAAPMKPKDAAQPQNPPKAQEVLPFEVPPLEVSDEERVAAIQQTSTVDDDKVLATYAVTRRLHENLKAKGLRISLTAREYHKMDRLKNGAAVLYQEIRKRRLQLPASTKPARRPSSQWER